jgi:hypothetical protein
LKEIQPMKWTLMCVQYKLLWQRKYRILWWEHTRKHFICVK